MHSSSAIVPGSPCVTSCHPSETGTTGSIELTSGQANALTTTALGVTAVAGGIITENPFMTYAGVGLFTEGATLSVIEFILNGDTTGYPNPHAIEYDIIKGIYEYNMNEETCDE